MTKGKMDTVRELLKLGRLSEARAILETINSPEARELLSKITSIQHNQLYKPPPVAEKRAVRERSTSSSPSVSWQIGVMVIAGFIILAVVVIALRNVVETDVELTPGPTEPQPTLYEIPMLDISPSVTASPVPTIVVLPTFTPTPTPSPTETTPEPLPTITGTIIPSDSTSDDARAVDCPNTDLVSNTCASELVDQGSAVEKPRTDAAREH
jgi:hypothetical protein